MESQIFDEDFETLEITGEFAADSKPLLIPTSASMGLRTDAKESCIEDQALEDWRDFILNVLGIILDLGFDFFKSNGKYNDMFQHYYLKATDSRENVLPERVYEISFSALVRAERRIETCSKAVKAQFRSVLVNGVGFDSYDLAESRVEQFLKAIR